MNVANASLSQIPFHQRIVTRSPNHMCAISWTMVSAASVISLSVTCSGSSKRRVSRNVTQPRFSIAPNEKSGSATRSHFSPGYGMP